MKYLLFVFLFPLILQAQQEVLKVRYVEEVAGDFSFRKNWSYPEGVYRNEFGQLSCDGICPEACESLKDASGKIPAQRLDSFYTLLDTTHHFHSLKSETNAYEWAGSDFMEFQEQEDGSILGESAMNAATHSQLKIRLDGEKSTAWILYLPNRDEPIQRFELWQGTMEIADGELKNGWIVARFDFSFSNPLKEDKVLFWRGIIYSKIMDL